MANLLIFFSTVQLLNVCGKVESTLLILKSWKIVELKRKTCGKFCGKLEENGTAKIFQKIACWNCWNKKSDFRGKRTGKDSRYPEKFPKFRAILSFHKLWKTLLKVFWKSVENCENGLESAEFFRWNRNIFREKTGFTDTIRLHIVEYAAVFSKPEIGNLFA